MHRHGWGGQPNRILTLCGCLRDRGHRVTLAAPRESTLARRARERGLDVYDDLSLPRGFHPWTYCEEVSKLKRLIEERGIRIVHTHGSQDTWAAAVAARLAKPSALVVRTRHNTNPVKNDFVHRRLYGGMIHRVIANSEAVREIFQRNKLVEPHRLETIFSAVDMERFDPSISGDSVREELGIPPDAPLVGITGHLNEVKGHKYFLEAARKVRLLVPSAMFLVVGEGPLDNEMEALALRLGLEGSVIFTGLRGDIPQVLASLDVFALSSVKESFPTAVLEALAMERPVVATRVGAIEQSMRDGVTGYLVPPADSDALAEKIVLALRDRKTALSMGKEGRRMVSEKFTVDIMVRRTEELYFKLLQEAGGKSDKES